MPLWYQNVRCSLLLVQSVLGAALFGYALRRRERCIFRAVVSISVCWVVCYLLQRQFYIPGSDPVAVLSHALTSCAVFASLIGVIRFCCDETIYTALFAASSGYIAQDTAGSVKQLMKQIPLMQRISEDDFGVLLVDLLCYGSLYALLFFAFRPYTRDREENFDDRVKAVFSTVALLVCIGMARLTQDNPQRNAMATIAENIYRILVDLLLLIIQFGVMERARLEGHMQTMRELIHQQRAQVESRKESVQLVNEKYHDLKHLLEDFKGKVPQRELRRLEQSLDRYDLHVDSGNAVLDVLLTEKLDICAQRGIALTCCLGRADFSFVDELDLYAIFHNALNNAIAAVSALPPGRERFISLSAASHGNMLSLHMENPCDGEIPFEDGLPLSAGDPDYHGFGMRSMARTAEKYGGTLAVKQENGMFYLDILMIAPEGSEKEQTKDTM